jgi:hypothetical protein
MSFKKERDTCIQNIFASYNLGSLPKPPFSAEDALNLTNRVKSRLGDLEKDLECQIVHGMKQSSHILLIESSSSLASPWVQFEADIARELNRSIGRLSLGKSPPFEAGPMMNCARLRPVGFDAAPLSAKITQAH